MSSLQARLTTLCRSLGEPARDWAILAEGNASARDGETFLVTSSGCSLDSPRFVRVDAPAVLAAIDDSRDDSEWSRRIAEASIEADDCSRATVEVGLHAVATSFEHVHYVGHTHPTSINGLLCSDLAEKFASSAVFPDQVVVCGANPLYLPYVDPGLALARAFREALDRHLETWREAPKVVYLGNHGLVALGATAEEVLQITSMADKAARVTATALAAGGVRVLPAAEVMHLDGRADEAYRRSVLAAAAFRR